MHTRWWVSSDTLFRTLDPHWLQSDSVLLVSSVRSHHHITHQEQYIIWFFYRLVVQVLYFLTHHSKCIENNNLYYKLNKMCTSVSVYSLIASLKTCHPTLHFTPWSLDLFIRLSFQFQGEHTVLQPFRRIKLIVHIAISVQPGIHFPLCLVKRLRVKCLAQGKDTTSKQCPKIKRGDDICLKILHQVGFETTRQAATLASSTL